MPGNTATQPTVAHFTIQAEIVASNQSSIELRKEVRSRQHTGNIHCAVALSI
jgi:hypothetical protein